VHQVRVLVSAPVARKPHERHSYFRF
jgi:hypothetical protein